MNIAIISPHSYGPTRGNITTVRRIARFVAEAGCRVTVFPMDALSEQELGERLRGFLPDLVHAFHARICGDIACRLARELNIPSVVTITGSDLFEKEMRSHPSTLRTLDHATAVVCFDECIKAELTRHFPRTLERLKVIPQGINPLPEVPAAVLDVPEDAFVILMPAALRPVKNVDFALRALAPLVRQLPALRLVIAGGTIDTGYARRVAQQAAEMPHALLLGEVPHQEMAGLYLRSDVVLNCSAFEGGTANSLLEAMAHGRGVLASDIAGNRALVREGETGWLYRDETEFVGKVAWLAAHAAERDVVGQRARTAVLEHFSPQREAGVYLALYESLHADLAAPG